MIKTTIKNQYENLFIDNIEKTKKAKIIENLQSSKFKKNEIPVLFFSSASMDDLNNKNLTSLIKKNSQKQMKHKLNMFLKFEKILKCNSDMTNDNNINIFQIKNKEFGSITKNFCSSKNCLKCKQRRLKKGIYQKFITKYKNFDKIKKFFLTVSSDVEFENINTFKKDVIEFKDKIKTYFDNKKIKFSGCVEIENKLHAHLLIFDIQKYSISDVSKEIRELLGFYNFSEKVTKDDNNYIAKLLKYSTKIEGQNKQNYIEVNQNFYIFFKNLASSENIARLNNVRNFLNDKNNNSKIQEMIKNINVFDKLFSDNYKINEKHVYAYALHLLNRLYYFLIKKASESIIQKEFDKWIVNGFFYDKNTGTLKNENSIIIKKTQIIKMCQDKINNATRLILKGAFNRVFEWVGLSLFFQSVIIDTELTENNKIKVYSNIFITSVFNRILFHNIRVVKKSKKFMIGNFKNIEVKFKENKKYDKEIKENEVKKEITIKNNLLLSDKFSKANDNNKLNKIFTKSTIKSKNKMFSLLDFNDNYKQLIFENAKKGTTKQFNRYKKQYNEIEFDKRLNELIDKNYNKKLNDFLIKYFIQDIEKILNNDINVFLLMIESNQFLNILLAK